MIEVRNLSKSYRTFTKKPGLLGSLASVIRRQWVDRKALDHVSFTAEKGEIFGLLGANGAGKTTLIKILSGILHAPDGYVRVDGHEPYKRDTSFRRSIALVMGQKAQLWWDLPAADSFLLLKEIYSLSDSQYKRSLDTLTEMLDTQHLLQIPLRRLSLGERMKMEIAAALLHNPSVIFLDEPTIGLDLKSQKAIRSFLLQYVKTYNPLVILTSHYIQDIEALCGRVLILRDGSVVYEGPLTGIRSHYRDERIIMIRSERSDGSLLHFMEQKAEEFQYRFLSKGDDFVQITAGVSGLEKLLSVITSYKGIADIRIESESTENAIESLQSGGSDS